jgi:molybdopterin synthase sulfur carrier subunit
MSIRILYFAALRETLGCSEERLDAVSGETLAALRQRLAERGGDWLALTTMKNLKAAINQTMASAEAPIQEGDEVAFFPPVTGG